ncbi:pectin acetylesterase 8-like [Ipomoea triloba]|uniref:pectin acetylesterase 8-like n=1 Tax=Ipomoea triloba TaxID=35885 RepID=UPI00125CD57D|nr:pectin acetylesterase 8-like [Ipomoea triloba]
MATIAAVILLLGFILTPLQANNVSISWVQNATDKGAVCLDGSPSAYYFDKGQGEGANNWLIYLEGGGWCVNQTDCLVRTTYSRGSSKHMQQSIDFIDFLSNNFTKNPEFYNWNRVYVPYCDGSSFTGDIEAPDTVTNVTYRGARIFKATMDDLLSMGMNCAENALLTGSSAGGLATMIHCDRFRELLPLFARVKCLPIAAYFVHEENLLGSKQFEPAFDALIDLHGSAGVLPPLCTSIMRPSLCLFPQYLLLFVKTPVFIAMSAFDQIQIRMNLFREDEVCLVSHNCTDDRKVAMQELRWDVLAALPKALPLFRGMWITNCIAHHLIYFSTLKIIGNKTYAEVFHDWYFDYNYLQVIDTTLEPRDCSEYGIYPQALN